MSRSTGRTAAAVLPLAVFLLSVFAVQAFPAVAAASTADPSTTFVANLTAAPGVSTGATGQATFQLSPNGTSLTYTLTVNNLNNVLMAHIHLAPSMAISTWLYPNPNNVPTGDEGNCLLVAMGGPVSGCAWLKSGVFSGVLAQGTISVADLSGATTCYGCIGGTFSQLVMSLESGQAFVNVHTSQNPGGEIQGTIQPASSSAAATPQLTVVTQDTNGQALTGYYTALYDSSGTVMTTGYSPQTFSLTTGATYSVAVENYGSCSFAAWSDGSAANPRMVSTATSIQLTAVYNCGTTSSGSSGATVNAVDENGNPLVGYYTSLWKGTSMTGSAFTPAMFSTLTPGQLYSVTPQNYGGCSFVQWTDGSLITARAFVATGTMQTFTAIYNCSSIGTSTVNVSTTNMGGSPLSGYYITLWQKNTAVKSCFSPCSFTVNNGQGYQITAASYGLEGFSHWSDGTTTALYPLVVPSQSTTMTVTAVFQP